jgi:hypothetical protein
MQDHHSTDRSPAISRDCFPDNSDDNLPAFLDDSEIPVYPRLGSTTAEDVGLRFGLPVAPNEEYRLIRNAFLLSLVDATLRGGLGVHYSRDRNWYSRFARTLPPYWTYAKVKRVCDDLIKSVDLFEHDLVKPGSPWRGKPRSSIVVTDAFLDLVSSDTMLLATEQVVDDIIVLRDASKAPISFDETEVTVAMRRQLERYNKAVAGSAITIEHPDAEPIGQGLFRVLHDGKRLLLKTSRRVSRRVFCNGSLQQGGRLFDPFWTNCPKVFRKSIQIDGEPTEEVDFEACHVRLAYAFVDCVEELRRFNNQDLYAAASAGPDDPLDRKVYKFATLIMLNARSRRSARGAIKHECLKHVAALDQDAVVKALMRRIEAAHPALKQLWFTGVGTTLQFIESEVLTSCLHQLLDRGIVGLSTHDAIRVAQRHETVTKEIMDATLEGRGFSLAKSMGPNPPTLAKRPTRARNSSGRDLTIGEETDGLFEAENIESHPSLPSARFARIPSRDSRPLPFAEALADLATIARVQASISPALATAARALFIANHGSHDSAEEWLRSLGLGEPPIGGAMSIPPPITAVKLARRLGITAVMANSMDLKVIWPRSESSMCRKTRRRLDGLMNGDQRRIVIIDHIKPWRVEGIGRGKWFARHGMGDDAQIAALRLAVRQGMTEVPAAVRSRLLDAEADRALLGHVKSLPVDSLISRVKAELEQAPSVVAAAGEIALPEPCQTDVTQSSETAEPTASAEGSADEVSKPGFLGWLRGRVTSSGEPSI